MAFGLSFGKKKNKVKRDTTTDVTETGTRAENSNRATSGTTTGSTSGTQASSGSTTGTQTARDATRSSGTTTGQTQNVSTLFGDDVLAGLEGLTKNLLGESGGGSSPSREFDSQGFIDGGVARASARQGLALDSDLNQIVDAIGGTAGGNSMAAILSNQLRGDFAANMAGVESDYTARANEIENSNIETGLAQSGQQQQFLTAILDNLRGGRAATTGTQQESTAQDTTGTSAGATSGTQQQQQSSQQASVQTQQLVEALSSLLNTNTNRRGTESVRGSEKSGGGGFSLGF